MTTTMHELYQAIAEALGPEWSSVTPTNQNWCSNLIHANGMSLFCEPHRGERLGIEVNAIESITEEGRIIFRYNRDRPSITVSATRDATAIARDIHSRLLPKATAWWEEGMKGKVKIEQERASKLQLQKRLLQLPGATLAYGPFDHNDARISTDDNDWIVYLAKHCITFNRMSTDEIVALIEAYHQLKGEPSQ